jgi:hypothetical protein
MKRGAKNAAISVTASSPRRSDKDFTKIHDSLADFSARTFGNKKAWAAVAPRRRYGAQL